MLVWCGDGGRRDGCRGRGRRRREGGGGRRRRRRDGSRSRSFPGVLVSRLLPSRIDQSFISESNAFTMMVVLVTLPTFCKSISSQVSGFKGEMNLPL